MQRCLQSPAILRAIARAVAEVDERDPSFGGDGDEDLDMSNDVAKTLLALALTSKAFVEPALGALWRHQVNLDYLVQLLPPSMRRPNKGRPTLVSDSPSRAIIQ